MTATSTLAAPPARTRRCLRVLGTDVSLLEQVQTQAIADLGVDISFEVLDFLHCQRKAALQPESYDIYDQCFHNLDIVWFWGALQPTDTERITDWGKLSGLTKQGGISSYAWRGHGDAPVNKLYVQPGAFLGPEPSRYISMLPTVYNLDSFAYDRRVFAPGRGARETWAWLLDPRARGRIALVDEPAIGIFDAALAVAASGEMSFADIGNMTIREIDALMALLHDRLRQGYFCAVWRNAAEAHQLICDGRIAAQSMWSPGYGDLGDMARVIAEAAPVEGYRAWHGGMSLSRHLGDRESGMAYDYMNWWLSGWAGAVMARQGYYMSIPDRVREVLTPGEWAYWYEGEPAEVDLPGPAGNTVVRAGARRSGGAYWDRVNRIAVWNTAMDEHNYAARAWEQFVAAVREISA